jgi:hypothetical protein
LNVHQDFSSEVTDLLTQYNELPGLTETSTSGFAVVDRATEEAMQQAIQDCMLLTAYEERASSTMPATINPAVLMNPPNTDATNDTTSTNALADTLTDSQYTALDTMFGLSTAAGSWETFSFNSN